MDPKAAGLIGCPACKGPLADRSGQLSCERCRADYPVTDGIPRLFPPSDSITVDVSELRLKTREESARTLAEMNLIDRGFIASPRIFYGIYILFVAALALRQNAAALVIAAVLAADWIFFRWRRGRILARALANPLRLRSVADHEAVDELYRREGREQPTMSDWVRLSREAEGAGDGDAGAGDQDDERYRDILAEYERTEPGAEVVADVGANDGRAYFEFGIGKGKVFIGIDVSRLLLLEFKRRVPGQTALQADGACLPLRDDSVDFLFCTETLEHIPDPARAIREFARVLRPGGRLMIQSPNAHRIRNLNPFHILTIAVSLAGDRVLQKKTVHENTWLNAVTYHWDFSVRDYRRMAQDAGLRVLDIRSRQFFFPRFLLGGRKDAVSRKERLIGSIPFLRMTGADLVMVAEAVR